MRPASKNSAFYTLKQFNFMKDIFLSIFKSSEERLKNPFIGTFILSLIVINWKPISVYLFSNQKIEEKIDFITSNYGHLNNLILYPLLVSTFYIAIIPYLMWLFESITFRSFKERNQNLYKNKMIDIEGKKTVALSEIVLENLKADYKEKADLNRQIESLKIELSGKELSIVKFQEKIEILSKNKIELENQVSAKEKSIDNLYEKLEEAEITTKNFYDEYENIPKSTVKDFINSLHMVNNAERFNENIIFIDRFIALGLLQIAKETNSSGKAKNEYIEITDKGLFFIKRAFSSRLV